MPTQGDLVLQIIQILIMAVGLLIFGGGFIWFRRLTSPGRTENEQTQGGSDADAG